MKVTRFLFHWGWIILLILFPACSQGINTTQKIQLTASFAFSSVLHEMHNIYLFKLDSETSWPLLADEEENTCPAFSPNGTQIAFCGKRGEKTYPFITGSDGSNPRILTDQVDACTCNSNAPLSWSPDGKWIALPDLEPSSNQYGYQIVIIRSDGSGIVNLTSTAQRYGGLLWDRDSQSMLISATLDGKPDIYRIKISSRKYQPLISQPVIGAPMDWSPDGSQLLYYADSGDGNFDIFLLEKGKEQPKRLTTAPGFDTYPQWFPDGKEILFISQRDGNHEVYRMNVDGSGQTNLTNNPMEMDIWPSLSPDGTKIIYLTSNNNQWESWMMNADGSGKRKMTGLIGIPATISWRP